eukprot:TRINITY_DN13003_c1_g1_i1.p3 TRINITY_DN13003_c1_g1~~TRINITY_DN13003_c1_g1_i1.p3  ORF type:complete len:101 (-),score=1.77 TRINITY_DN13003_c1_g1_i1:393-695(-)
MEHKSGSACVCMRVTVFVSVCIFARVRVSKIVCGCLLSVCWRSACSQRSVKHMVCGHYHTSVSVTLCSINILGYYGQNSFCFIFRVSVRGWLVAKDLWSV